LLIAQHAEDRSPSIALRGPIPADQPARLFDRVSGCALPVYRMNSSEACRNAVPCIDRDDANIPGIPCSRLVCQCDKECFLCRRPIGSTAEEPMVRSLSAGGSRIRTRRPRTCRADRIAALHREKARTSAPQNGSNSGKPRSPTLGASKRFGPTAPRDPSWNGLASSAPENLFR
jgi:hypothetical protein